MYLYVTLRETTCPDDGHRRRP